MQTGTLKILLADDDPVSRRLAELMLQRLGQPRPDLAADGREALDLALERNYDLVLMDLEMPGLGGREVARAIVRERGAQRPHLVIMTAAEDGREACIAAGADDHLAKPVTQQRLAAALARVRPRQGAAEDFNPEAWAELRRVFRGAGAIELVEAAVADLPEQQRRHAAAVQGGDLAALGRIVHALRGACLQFGATALAQLGAEAEAACLAQRREPALTAAAEVLTRYAALVRRLEREVVAD